MSQETFDDGLPPLEKWADIEAARDHIADQINAGELTPESVFVQMKLVINRARAVGLDEGYHQGHEDATGSILPTVKAIVADLVVGDSSQAIVTATELQVRLTPQPPLASTTKTK